MNDKKKSEGTPQFIAESLGGGGKKTTPSPPQISKPKESAQKATPVQNKGKK